MKRVLLTLWILACAVLPASSVPLPVLLTGGGGICSASVSALARLPTILTTVTANKYITAICALASTNVTTSGLTGTLWSNMFYFHIYASDNTPDALIDLTGHGFNSVVYGSPIFYPDVGYQGDAATSNLNTGFVESTNGFTTSSGSYGVLVANQRTTGQTWSVVGGINGTSQSYILPLYTNGDAYGAVASTAGVNAVESGGTQGLWTVSRTSTTAEALYKGNTLVASGSGSGVLSTYSTIVLAYYSSPGTIGRYSGDTVSADFAGPGLNATDVAALNTILAPLIPASIPSTGLQMATAWGYTNQIFAWTPTGTSDFDMGLTNGPGYNWYLTQFWGIGNPSTSDITYNAGGYIVNNPSVNSVEYRTRVSSRGNTSSTFQGSISSGGVLTVTSMIGVLASGGTTAFNNPIIVGASGTCQLLAGAGMGITQPSNGICITAQLTGTGGATCPDVTCNRTTGTYSLATNPGAIASEVMNGYSSVGAIPAFSPGGYYEYCFTFNPAQSPASGNIGDIVTLEMTGLNSYWGFQYVTNSNISQMHSGEIDQFQLYGNVAGTPSVSMANIDEYAPSYYMNWEYTTSSPSTPSAAQLGSPNYNTKQCAEILWVTTTKNGGGTGFVYHFMNNVLVPSLTTVYSPTLNVTYNGVGFFYASESDKWVLNWDGGYGQPLNLYSVTVTH